MSGCTVFNQPFTIPKNLATIQSGNLFYNCGSMVSPININGVSADVFPAPTQYSDSMFKVPTSSAAYTQGMTLVGDNRTAWLAKLPNTTSGTYRRNLKDGGPAEGSVGYAIINGGTTAPTTATSGVVGTLYSYVDSATGTPHVLVCTEVTAGGTYTWEDLLTSVETALRAINNGGE